MSDPKHHQIGFGNDDKNPKPAWPWVGFLLVVFVSLLSVGQRAIQLFRFEHFFHWWLV